MRIRRRCAPARSCRDPRPVSLRPLLRASRNAIATPKGVQDPCPLKLTWQPRPPLPSSVRARPCASGEAQGAPCEPSVAPAKPRTLVRRTGCSVADVVARASPAYPAGARPVPELCRHQRAIRSSDDLWSPLKSGPGARATHCEGEYFGDHSTVEFWVPVSLGSA